jgi:hypothetical protein
VKPRKASVAMIVYALIATRELYADLRKALL